MKSLVAALAVALGSFLLAHVLFARLGQRSLAWRERLGALVATLESRCPAQLRQAMRRRLDEAGRPPLLDERRLFAATAALLVLALVASIGAAAGLASPALPVALSIGAAAPWFWLVEKGRARKEAIARELPVVLDLFALALESGTDLLGALARVSERLRPGALRDELVHALRELRLARPKREVFADLAVRTGSPELSRMVAVVLQADRMGAPLAESLRLLAEQILQERFLLAEKKAAQAPVKMLLPLVAFIFPAVFVVLFAPIALTLLRG